MDNFNQCFALQFFKTNSIAQKPFQNLYRLFTIVTVNGAEVGRLPQSELSNNALLASIKEKSQNNQGCLI